MPKHLALGVNVLSGTLEFSGVKSARVMYVNILKQPVLFAKEPKIMFSPLGEVLPKPKAIKDATGKLFAGFSVGFNAPMTATLEWMAVERD